MNPSVRCFLRIYFPSAALSAAEGTAFSRVTMAAVIAAVSGTANITPTLLATPLMTSVATYGELISCRRSSPREQR